MNPEIFKQISIRGRFAFGLKSLENIVQYHNIQNSLLDSIIEDFWRFTNVDKPGALEDFFITRNPFCILSDYPTVSVNPEKMYEFGYDNISLSQMKDFFELYSALTKDITDILANLSIIANSNISAGCGEYSILTYEPTVKIIQIMNVYPLDTIPKPEDFLFSNFEQNHGWGNKFPRI
ncbi:hypothetical protein [Cytophaga aurantiaca]|uniref:hypothetical protein n=1 Tax=Cytophaga aurantiaca TaxID=29530 RepID=UPI00037F5546|nr:hypothetical protein [Cytophaga aurantiaca]